MRYHIGGLTIRTENAAKLPHEISVPLVTWILEHVNVTAALDYGCGKLRYSPCLISRARRLGLVDSEVQLDRPTQLEGEVTTVRSHAATKWPSCRVYSIEEFWRGVPECYDFVLCANVLSAIPSARIRTQSLRAIRDCLSTNGTALFVSQHTNSYFTKARADKRSVRHLDGWILKSHKGACYFGILSRERVVSLLSAQDFAVRDSWIEGQSNYVLASR